MSYTAVSAVRQLPTAASPLCTCLLAFQPERRVLSYFAPTRISNNTVMSLDEEFAKAAQDVKELSSTPSDADLLDIYALYKQATVGECNTDRPGMFDLKGKAKWDAWNGIKGTLEKDAKRRYVDKVNALVASIGKK